MAPGEQAAATMLSKTKLNYEQGVYPTPRRRRISPPFGCSTAQAERYGDGQSMATPSAPLKIYP